MSEVQIIHTTGRNNCGSRCLLHAHVQDGKILKFTGEKPDPEGDEVPLCACAKGYHYHETYLSEDRLRWPMKRVGERGEGKFERISWEEAVETIYREWVRIRDTYGPASRYVAYATGEDALMRAPKLIKRLLSLDGGYTDYYNSYSTACIRQATLLMYGTDLNGHNPKDWLNSGFILLWGHNPAETGFSSETMYYLRKARDKGIPIAAVDPRENDTIRQLGAQWIPLRPATDAALADAMAYVIYTEKLHDQAFLDRCCLGFDEAHMPEGVDPSLCYRAYLMGEKDGVPKTPEWAETITGVPAETARSLARRFAKAGRAALIQGYGAQRHAYGEQSTRGGILLACMTGNVGVSGGWASGTADYNVHRFPVFPMPENPCKAMIPTYLWTDAVDHGRDMTAADGVRGADRLGTDIRMIFNLAGNCLINQHGDINRTSEILRDTSKCEFIVCSDLFMTASAKFADILLPGISQLEMDNITVPWIYGEFIGFSRKLVEPLYEGRFEYDWIRELAARLGREPEFSLGRTCDEWLRACYDELREVETELPDYETLRDSGIYRYRHTEDHIAFEQECADPKAHPFPTDSGLIEIFSKRVLNAPLRDPFPPIPGYVPPPEGPQDPLKEKYPLQMIGWHTKRRCHSIHDNTPALQRIDTHPFWMHPADAEARGIREGDEVIVRNDRGSVRVPVHLTERIMRGVTAMSQGAWYRPDKNGVDRGGCINTLTSLRPTPYARGNGQHTNLVEVVKA